MQILILVAFVVAMTCLNSPLDMPYPAQGRWCFYAIAVYLVLTACLSALNTTLALKALSAGRASSPASSRRRNIQSVLTQFCMVGGLAAIISAGYGQWLKEDLGLGRLPLLGDLAAVAPFLLAVLIVWLTEYPLHRALRARLGVDPMTGKAPPIWTLRDFLAFNCRHHLLFIAVPVSIILLLTESLTLYLGPYLSNTLGSEDLGDLILLVGASVLSGGVFFFSPLLLVRIWKTHRLEDCPLRADLEAMCRRLKFRYREILVWESAGVIANAGVMGLAGPVRYILLSDALMESMDSRQVVSVFGHEAGHVIGHHIFYSLLFAVTSAALSAELGNALAWAMHWQGRVADPVSLVPLAAAWAFGFGWISRRFEWQSDAVSAWLMSAEAPPADGAISPIGAMTFAAALHRVADVNGIGLTQRNWRHGTIQERIDKVLRLGEACGSRRELDRVVRRIKIGLWAALALAVAAGAVQTILAR